MYIIIKQNVLKLIPKTLLIDQLGSGSSIQDDEDGVTPDELKELRQGLVKVLNEAFLEKLYATNEVNIYEITILIENIERLTGMNFLRLTNI